MYICESCKKEHNGTYGSGRFCTSKCSHKRLFSNESKELLSKSLAGIKHIHPTKCCEKCNCEISAPNYKKHIEKCDGFKKERFKKLKVCPYCGINVINVNATNHIRHCILNPNYEYYQNKLNNARKQITPESRKRQGQTLKKSYLSGKYDSHCPSFKGKKHSEESKEQMRISAFKRLVKNGNLGSSNFSKNACNYIDKLNEENGWNLQHAQNGGEYYISGYFIDGYDKEKNIAFEYDEKKHYKNVSDNILKDKDIERQNNIIKRLNCKFYRYNETIDYFYEVQ